MMRRMIRWIKPVRLILIVVGLANIIAYFANGSYALLMVGVILVCSGIVILGYLEAPASFHRSLGYRRGPKN